MERNIPNRKVVTLVVTEYCNLKCTYCYQYSKSKKFIPIEIAKEKLKFHFNNSDGFDEIEIDLFGGEPFMRPDFIIELVEWTKKSNFKKPFIFFASTNGTKIHGHLQEWIIKNKDYIWLGLSIDGKPKTHNLNRSNSYFNIDIDFFINTYPLQPARMTINEVTLSHLYDNITYLHGLGFNVDAAFAQGVKWINNNNKVRLISELKKLCNYYINFSELKICSILDIYFPAILLENNYLLKENIKSCGSGTNMVAVDINGNDFPCQIFLPSSMPQSCNWQNIDFSNVEFFISNDCTNCLIKNICSTCYGINLRDRANVTKRDLELCEFNRILALASSYIYGNRIANGNYGKYKTNTELLKTLKAISLIQKNYSPLYSIKN